jgi:hypothetical protein
VFETLIKGLADKELAHLLTFIDEELDGVEARLHEKAAGEDSMAMMLAMQQLDLLDVWRPMVKNLILKLEAHDENPTAIE